MEAQRLNDLATAEVVEQVYKLALEGDPQTNSLPTNSPPALNSPPNMSSNPPPPPPHRTTPACSSTTQPTPPTYSWLVHLDHELRNHTSRFVDLVGVAESLPVSSATTTVASLNVILGWVSDHASQLDCLQVIDPSTLQLRDAIMDNLLEVRSYMTTVLKVLEDRDGLKPPDFRGSVVLMGGSLLSKLLSCFF